MTSGGGQPDMTTLLGEGNIFIQDLNRNLNVQVQFQDWVSAERSKISVTSGLVTSAKFTTKLVINF